MRTLLKSDDVKALIDIGFIALSAGLLREAATIFNGVQASCPHEPAGRLGTALIHMAWNELDEAIEILRKLPPTEVSRTFMGLALLRLGNKGEAREILTSVVSEPGELPFIELAKAGLQELHK